MKNNLFKKSVSVFLAVLMLLSCWVWAPEMSGGASLASAANETLKDHYLFAYFTGTSQEGQTIHLAVSEDGYNYTALRDNEPVIIPSKGVGCVRDPYIWYNERDNYYYILATDLDFTDTGGEYSTHSESFIFWRSKDLIHWYDETFIDVHGMSDLIGDVDNMLSAWAPQVLWDGEAYMVYFSLQCNETGGNLSLVYLRTTDLMDPDAYFEYGVLFDPNVHVIDADIIYREADDLYYLFYKTEGGNSEGVKTIYYLVADDPYGPYRVKTDVSGTNDATFGHRLYPNVTVNLEGCNSYFDNDGALITYTDEYEYTNASGAKEAHFHISKTTDFDTFTMLNDSVHNINSLSPRHGSVVKITQEEYNRLLNHSDSISASSFPDTEVLEDHMVAQYFTTSDAAENAVEGKANLSSTTNITMQQTNGKWYANFNAGYAETNLSQLLPNSLNKSDGFTITFTATTSSSVGDNNHIYEIGYPRFGRVDDANASNYREEYYSHFSTSGDWRGAYLGLYNGPNSQWTDWITVNSGKRYNDGVEHTYLISHANGNTIIYIDGELQVKKNRWTCLANTEDWYDAIGKAGMYIGKSAWSGDPLFTGTIHDFRIYDCSMSYYDIQELQDDTVCTHPASERYTVESREPTCALTGLTAGEYCLACGEVLVEQETIAALAHTFGDPFTANGVEYVECEVCGFQTRHAGHEIRYENMFSLNDWVESASCSVDSSKGTITPNLENGTVTIVNNHTTEVVTPASGSDGMRNPDYYCIKVEGGEKYVLEYTLTNDDAGAGAGEMFIFPFTQYGYHIGSYGAYCKTGTKGTYTYEFTAPADAMYVELRFDANNASKTTTFSNIGFYTKESYDTYAKENARARECFVPGDEHHVLITPKRVGYNFLGWYTSSGEKVVDTNQFTLSETLHAKWEPIGNTVRYNGNLFSLVDFSNSSSYAMQSNVPDAEIGIDFAEGKLVTQSPRTGAGYSNLTDAQQFDTYNVCSSSGYTMPVTEGKEYVFTYTNNVASNVQCYIWFYNDSGATVNATTGGSWINLSTNDEANGVTSVLKGATRIMRFVVPTGATKLGFRVGTTNVADSRREFFNIGLYEAADFDERLTYTGAGCPAMTYVPGGESVALATPEREAAIFNGWYTGKNGSGTKITDTSTLTDDVVVYPKWTAVDDINYDNLFSFSDWANSASSTMDSAKGSVSVNYAAGTITFSDIVAWSTTYQGSASVYYKLNVVSGETYTVKYDVDVNDAGYVKAYDASGTQLGYKTYGNTFDFTATADAAYIAFGSRRDCDSVTYSNIRVYKKTDADKVDSITYAKVRDIIDSDLTLITPTRSGYHFHSWNDANGTALSDATARALTASTTVYSQWGTLTATAEKAATCTQAGNKAYWTCSCGKVFSDATATTETTVAAMTTSALGHTGGTANCVDKAVCTRCNTAYGSVNASNHKTLTTLAAVAATCTTTGLTEGQKCSACGVTTKAQTTVAAKGHTFGATTAAQAATCLAAGNTAYKQCTTCKLYFAADAATNATDGKADTTSFEIAMLSHSYTGAYKSNGDGETATHSRLCVNGCNQYGGATAHTWNDGVIVPDSTCLGTGTKTFTCTATGCGATYTETVAAKGHTFGATTAAQAATCLAAGNTAYKQCTTCNLYFAADAATNATDGNSNKTSFEIAQLSHSYTGAIMNNGSTADGTHSFKCVNGCGKYGGEVKHTYTSSVTTDPTCTETGVKTYTCTVDGCGATYTEDVDANGHTFVNDVAYKAPTCKDTGNYAYKECSECNKYFHADATESEAEDIYDNIDEFVIGTTACSDYPTPNEADVVWTLNDSNVPVKAEITLICQTCSTAKTFTVSGYGVDIYETGSSAGNCVTPSTKTYRAEFYSVGLSFSATKKVDGDLGAHSYGDLITGTPATCTATGKIDHYICSVEDCGKYFDKDKNEVSTIVIEMAAHTPGAAATCTTAQTCTVCSTELSPKLNHSYTEYDTKNTFTWTPGVDGADPTAVINLICANDNTHKTTADATVTYKVGEDTPGNCVTMGKKNYVATYTLNGVIINSDIYAVDNAYGDHDWADATYEWTAKADGGYTVTATRVCNNNSAHVETATATVASEVTTLATCTTMGWTTYTATFTESWAATQTKAVQDIAKLAHKYEATFTWTEVTGAAPTAKANLKCADCVDKVNDLEATVDETNKDNWVTVGCEVEGKQYYKATVTYNKATYTSDVYTVTIGKLGHADANKDHVCDNKCSVVQGTHEDTNSDHKCDYGCSEAIGTCADADKDHTCDYGCGKAYGTHEDTNLDHKCDYGCSEAIGTCEDADKDHTCDYGCGKAYGEHVDTDLDHKCDYGCSEAIGTCADADKDHTCDYGCGKAYGEHKDSADDNDHVCDYGCGTVLEECSGGTATCATPKICEICGNQYGDVDANNHDYDETKSEANLTRPVYNEATGEWLQAYYTYTCKNDVSHKKTENVARANYTEYEAAWNALVSLLATDLKQDAKDEIQKVLDDNNIAKDRIVTEQSIVNKATENLKVAFETYKGNLMIYTVTFVIDGVETETTVISGNAAVAPTEVKKAPDAKYHYVFTSWDKEFTNITSDITVTAQFDSIEHTYTSTVTTKASCFADGVRTYTCSANCGSTYTETIAKRTHNLVDTIPATNATCTETGVMNQRCDHVGTDEYEACAYTTTRVIPALGHSYGELIAEVPAKCEKDGAIAHYTCSTCTANFDENKKEVSSLVIPATGHDYDNGVVTTDPTCEAAGVKTFTCKNDASHTYTQEVAALGHDYKKTTVDANCETAGYTETTCSRCDYYKKDVIDATGHNYGEWTIAEVATCTKGNVWQRVCANCDDVDEKVDDKLTAHVLVIVNGTPATCHAPGSTDYHYCIACDYKEESKVIPQLKHDDADGDGKCDTCDGIMSEGGTCGCICHKEFWLMRIIYKIVRFFWKLFGIGKSCSCGTVHY